MLRILSNKKLTERLFIHDASTHVFKRNPDFCVVLVHAYRNSKQRSRYLAVRVTLPRSKFRIIMWAAYISSTVILIKTATHTMPIECHISPPSAVREHSSYNIIV